MKKPPVPSLFGFDRPVHDLASALASEGRWSGRLFDADFNAYVIRPDNTAPIVLFGPLVALIAWRGWRTIRRQRTIER